MRLIAALVALLAMVFAAHEVRADDAAMKEYLGLGEIRLTHAGVVVGPILSPGKIVREAAGGGSRDASGYRGVEVDLASELALKLGVKLLFQDYSSSKWLALTGQVAEWTFAFVPVDEALNEYITYGSAYVELQATYLVRPSSRITRMADVDKPGVRVAGIDGSAVVRAAERSLKNATVTKMELKGVSRTDQVLQLLEPLTSGQAEAIALSREEAAALSAALPGARVLDGAFWKSWIAIALAGGPNAIVVKKADGSGPSRAEVLDYLSAFVDNAIRAGTVRQALDKHGMKGAKIPPPGTRL